MLDFQPETTLFVCNKWDAVEEEEEREVLNFISNKLQSIWPNVNPDKQMFKLSCKEGGLYLCVFLLLYFKNLFI